MEKDFFKKYTIEEELGAGGFGVVHKIKSKSNSKEYAIKLIKKSVVDENIERETSLLKSLKHLPNIVKYKQTFESINYNGTEYYGIMTNYVKGYALNKLHKCLKEEKVKIPPNVILKYMEKLFETLAYLHEKDVVHRDVKAGNIIFSELNLTLIDFGFSCYTSNVEKFKCDSKGSGTPNYLSPEIWNRLQTKDITVLKKADVWAAGITFYLLTNYTLPFEPPKTITKPDFSVMSKSKYVDDDKQLEEFINKTIDKCLTVDYEKRPSAKDVYCSILLFIVEREIS